MPVSYDKLKERYKPQMLYYVNTGRLTYIATCIQCGLDTLLNMPFKSIFGLCEHQHAVLVPCLHSGDFRVPYLAFNSRSRIHIPCAH